VAKLASQQSPQLYDDRVNCPKLFTLVTHVLSGPRGIGVMTVIAI
jgi:hypothetical protein